MLETEKARGEKKRAELCELQNMSVEDIFKNTDNKAMKLQYRNAPPTLRSPEELGWE